MTKSYLIKWFEDNEVWIVTFAVIIIFVAYFVYLWIKTQNR